MYICIDDTQKLLYKTILYYYGVAMGDAVCCPEGN